MHAVHTRAPLRLGLAGGGTDVAPYSDLYGGRVLNATISLSTQVHLTVGERPEVRFTALETEESVSFPLVPELPLEEPLLLQRAVYNRIVRDFNHGEPIPVHLLTYSDAPPGSGVGSSSTLVVALVSAFQELLQLPLGEYDLAHLAYRIERLDCAMAGGKQDQYAAAFGGFNFMEFAAEDRVVVNPLRVKPEVIGDLESRLLLYFTGRSRSSARIIQHQIDATSAKEAAAIQAMHNIRSMAEEMKEMLLKGRVDTVLDLLGRAWVEKKHMAKEISNDYIDGLAEKATGAGAHALKISGAGGGGFMMIGVNPRHRYQVMRALDAEGGRFYPFRFVDHGVETWRCRE